MSKQYSLLVPITLSLLLSASARAQEATSDTPTGKAAFTAGPMPDARGAVVQQESLEPIPAKRSAAPQKGAWPLWMAGGLVTGIGGLMAIAGIGVAVGDRGFTVETSGLGQLIAFFGFMPVGTVMNLGIGPALFIAASVRESQPPQPEISKDVARQRLKPARNLAITGGALVGVSIAMFAIGTGLFSF